jgi:hypothetical protein
MLHKTRTYPKPLMLRGHLTSVWCHTVCMIDHHVTCWQAAAQLPPACLLQGHASHWLPQFLGEAASSFIQASCDKLHSPDIVDRRVVNCWHQPVDNGDFVALPNGCQHKVCLNVVPHIHLQIWQATIPNIRAAMAAAYATFEQLHSTCNVPAA